MLGGFDLGQLGGQLGQQVGQQLNGQIAQHLGQFGQQLFGGGAQPGVAQAAGQPFNFGNLFHELGLGGTSPASPASPAQPIALATAQQAGQVVQNAPSTNVYVSTITPSASPQYPVVIAVFNNTCTPNNFGPIAFLLAPFGTGYAVFRLCPNVTINLTDGATVTWNGTVNFISVLTNGGGFNVSNSMVTIPCYAINPAIFNLTCGQSTNSADVSGFLSAIGAQSASRGLNLGYKYSYSGSSYGSSRGSSKKYKKSYRKHHH